MRKLKRIDGGMRANSQMRMAKQNDQIDGKKE